MPLKRLCIALVPRPRRALAAALALGLAMPAVADDAADLAYALRYDSKVQARAWIDAQPDLTRLMGKGGGSFDLDARDDYGKFSFLSRAEWPIWTTATGKWSSGSNRLRFHGLIGRNLHQGNKLRYGVMLQFAHSERVTGGGRVDRAGLMAGPYLVRQLQDQPLTVTASYLAGITNVTARRTTGLGDDLIGLRGLATLGVSGKLKMPRLTLSPSLSFDRLDELRPAHRATTGERIGTQSARLLDMTAGMTFVHPLRRTPGALDLTGGVRGRMSWTGTEAADTGWTSTRVDLGFSRKGRGGRRTRLGGYLDGLGRDATALVYGMKLSHRW